MPTRNPGNPLSESQNTIRASSHFDFSEVLDARVSNLVNRSLKIKPMETHMLATLVAVAFFAVLGAFSAYWYYLNVLDRRIEAAHVARFKSLSPAERQQMLLDARSNLCQARRNFEYVQKLWATYKWGRNRNNPHNIPRLTAAMEVSRLRHLLGSLEQAAVAV